MYNKQTYKIMGFMNGKVVAEKADRNKANVIGNIVSSLLIAIFITAMILVASGTIGF